jgi:hypothetical protein
MGLSDYEYQALAQVNAHKSQQVARSPRRLVPRPTRSAGRGAVERLERLPGATPIEEAALKGFMRAAEGTGTGLSRAGRATLSEKRVVDAYNRRGLAIERLDDVQWLDLATLDMVRPKRMNLAYGAIAAAEGGAAGAMATGGEALAVTGGIWNVSARAAPGTGAVARAMAFDAGFVLTTARRAVAHTALCYGYDPLDPAESLYSLSVINLGSALSAGGKASAYQELSQITQLLARPESWQKRLEDVLPRLTQQFTLRFGGRLTQRKLGQLVPIAGIGVGAWSSYTLLDDVTAAAGWSYRERFILRKMGPEAHAFVPQAPASADGPGETEVTIDLLKIMDQVGIDISGSSDRGWSDEWPPTPDDGTDPPVDWAG